MSVSVSDLYRISVLSKHEPTVTHVIPVCCTGEPSSRHCLYAGILHKYCYIYCIYTVPEHCEQYILIHHTCKK
jgi:hypothetical protein